MTFPFDPALVERVKGMPYADFDPETKSWTSQVCTQSVELLRKWYYEGLVDSSVDDLVDAEALAPVSGAVLRRGSMKRPYRVVLALRDDNVYAQLRGVSGSMWEKESRSVSFPSSAAAALSEMAAKGTLSDPEHILSPAGVMVIFDSRTGRFVVTGDARATESFDKHFPGRDVVGAWLERGLDVAFADAFAEEVYRGELARARGAITIEGFGAELWPYQGESVAVALERTGFGVFHEMGLGKTVIAIAAGHELLFNRQGVPRVVVVVPGAIRTQWAKEIARFSTGKVVVVDGDAKKRAKAYEEAKDAQWLIVHYDVLSRDIRHLSPLVSGALLIADEAHRLKSPKASRTKAMKTLSQRAARRLALSGTPILNDPGEWFSVISGFVAPGCFGSPIDFLNRYSFPNRWGGYEGARNLAELSSRSATYYTRYTKPEVAPHLPPLRIKSEVLDVDPAYRAALVRAHREARTEIKAAAVDRAISSGRLGLLDGELRDDVETGAEMTAVGMLRLLCLSPRVVLASDSPAAQALYDAGLLPDEDGPKVEKLLDIAAEVAANGERVAVFSSSKRMVYLLAERLGEAGISYVTFTGDTNRTDRDEAVEAFTTAPTTENPGPTVFLATDAGGEGLNLGACCSLLVNMDIPWTPGVLAQRSARIHRIDGTAERYLVINLTLRGTIEEGILRMVEHKADLVDAIFGENGGRLRTTGRRGRNVFEQALEEWDEHG
jgi:superfamily II DNA or RNA helicase